MAAQVFSILILSLLIFFFSLFPGSQQEDGSMEERLAHRHEGTKETCSQVVKSEVSFECEGGVCQVHCMGNAFNHIGIACMKVEHYDQDKDMAC